MVSSLYSHTGAMKSQPIYETVRVPRTMNSIEWVPGDRLNQGKNALDHGRFAFIYTNGTLYCGGYHMAIIRALRAKGIDVRNQLPETQGEKGDSAIYGWFEQRIYSTPR